MNYHTETLPSGLRVIALPGESQVVYCGIIVHGGTRNEQPGEEGLAHFCEHLSFKGTRRRTAVQIINAIEGVGGELNAFTQKEDTVYYAAVTRQHLRRALSVLTDIVFHSQYPQAEIEKECEVVCDEIDSYEDSPADLIFDEFENILFEGHPLGHNILGTASQVRSYTHDHVERFAARYYRPDNCVLFVSGGEPLGSLPSLGPVASLVPEAPVALAALEAPVTPAAPAALAALEAPALPAAPAALEAPAAPVAPSAPAPLSSPIVRHRGTHQAHVMLGTRTFPANDPRRWALFLLNNILGGPGMNSRLNLSLRERRALVYTVESQMVTYSDTGLWSVYFGCDPADVNRCLRLVRRELDRLMERPLSPTQLTRAKRQLCGQLAIASENREQFALDMAKVYLHEGRLHSLDYVLEHIEALTADDLWLTARELFAPERLTTLVYD